MKAKKKIKLLKKLIRKRESDVLRLCDSCATGLMLCASEKVCKYRPDYHKIIEELKGGE